MIEKRMPASQIAHAGVLGSSINDAADLIINPKRYVLLKTERIVIQNYLINASTEAEELIDA